MWDTIIVFLEDNAILIGSLGGVAGVAAFVGGVLKWPFSKTKPTELSEETIQKIKPTTPVETAALTVPQFIAIRREMKADLEQELTTAHEGEKTELRARIAELQSQIDAPDKALAEAQKTIADLKARLARMGNEVGGDRLAEAEAALAKLDFSVADEIFADVEERQKLEVQRAARAAFGRGEVAEAEVRWHDAAEHYARAARLEPDFQSLMKAHEFALRAGDYSGAFRHGEDLLSLARSGDNREQLASALNNHALTLKYQGQFSEAEALYREALEIDEKTIGTAHPDYAIRLNNLAGVVGAQGRYEEAEALFREALAIDEKTIGTAHPDYAIHLNNLALVVKAQGRYEEAEALFREALAIDEKTIGTAHPDYAIDLNNLALVVEAQSRYEEAEALYREAIEIALDRLGADHPNTKAFQANLDKLLANKP